MNERQVITLPGNYCYWVKSPKDVITYILLCFDESEGYADTVLDVPSMSAHLVACNDIRPITLMVNVHK